jgi:hypothetical protein
MSASIKVRFQGVTYWLLCEPDGDYGPLAFLEHCDERGKINGLDSALSDSFAHLFPDGRLMQYGRQIGTREDLERV